MRILQVSTADKAGGAEGVARNLAAEYLRRGHESWLAVGLKRGDDPFVIQIDHAAASGPVSRALDRAGKRLLRTRFHAQVAAARLDKAGAVFSAPQRWVTRSLGHEDYSFPATRSLAELPPVPPDVIHCHNLHGAWLVDGGYFDLRVLPTLGTRVPLVLTLHDAWLLSGHCAHSFDCQRWRTGCGACPDLDIYPRIERDGTAFNWKRKQRIFAGSSLYIATPSRWLMRKVEDSMLAPGVAEMRLVPYGIDQNVFKTAQDRRAVRARLGIPEEAHVLMFAANGIRQNVWKDFRTLRSALVELGDGDDSIVFIGLGEDAPPERIGNTEIRFVPHQDDAAVVAAYYQAADAYVHAARADTFPNAILEALACGTPVVATAVGGIPEQINDFGADDRASATGFLVSPGDAQALAQATSTLLSDSALRRMVSTNAARDAVRRFDLQREADDYLLWYKELLERRETPRGSVY